MAQVVGTIGAGVAEGEWVGFYLHDGIGTLRLIGRRRTFAFAGWLFSISAISRGPPIRWTLRSRPLIFETEVSSPRLIPSQPPTVQRASQTTFRRARCPTKSLAPVAWMLPVGPHVTVPRETGFDLNLHVIIGHQPRALLLC